MKRRIKARINLLTEGEMITLLKRINSSILWEGEELAFNWEVYAILQYDELSLRNLNGVCTPYTEEELNECKIKIDSEVLKNAIDYFNEQKEEWENKLNWSILTMMLH